MGIFDILKNLGGEKTTNEACRKCAKLIKKSKSTIVAEAKDYGYCPMCKKLFCKKCACATTLEEEAGNLECPICNVKLKGSL